MKNVSKLQAIVEGKCPRCRMGKMFKYPVWKVSKFTAMHELCPVCGLRFQIEPGFFFVAAYVSYALTTGVAIAVCAGLYFFANDPALWVYMVTVTFFIILLLPVLFRYSRILSLYLFGGIRYDKKYSRKV